MSRKPDDYLNLPAHALGDEPALAYLGDADLPTFESIYRSRRAATPRSRMLLAAALAAVLSGPFVILGALVGTGGVLSVVLLVVVVAPLVEEMLKVAGYHTSCPSSVGQRAALMALKTDESQFDAMAKEFGERCEFVFQSLQKMPDTEVNPVEGSFYIFPKIAALNPDCEHFAFDLLDQEQVVVIPGSAFGPSGKGFVRLACTVDKDRLTEAMDRLERFIFK